MNIDQQKVFMHEDIRLSMENVQSGNGGQFGAFIVKN